MLRKAVKHVGRVIEVKMYSKECSNFRSGRAMVEIDLQIDAFKDRTPNPH
jgi:hypothetical protein